MGWTHCQSWKTRDEVVKAVMEGLEGQPSALVWEQKTWVHWVLAPMKGGGELIVCHLLEPSPNGWGYKGMDESMGPYYYSCPLEFLERTDDSPWKNARWRLEVLQRRAAG
jgi:hypothetical protein